MKLLIVTQKIDRADENLGFFCGWLDELKKHFDELTVITSESKEKDSLEGVEVFSLGKERGYSKTKRICKFLELFSKLYPQNDAVFFHMSPEFVVAASPFIWSLKKNTSLWYTHKQVTTKLKIAERFVDNIITASSASCRLSSPKIKPTGHAIDTDRFVPSEVVSGQAREIKLLVLGRISPVKDIETVLRASLILKNSWQKPWKLSIVGGPLLPRDSKYLETLKGFVKDNGLDSQVFFAGPVAPKDAPAVYQSNDIFISMSGTGSVDKSVLEAMSSGCSVVTANEAFASILPATYFLGRREPELLAEKIKILAKDKRPNLELRNLVVANHSLRQTIGKISDIIKNSK